MQTKEDYKTMLSMKRQLKQKVKTDPYRLGFHLMPPTGWLNDPNGLCSFKGTQHIYFQYSPFTTTWGMKLWGHYTTKDWIHYKEEEPFLFADCAHDKDGVYSGSAFVKDGKIHYYYTGNVKYTDKEYNYVCDGREQNTMEVISNDGYTLEEKQLILSNLEYPDDMSCHVRDPKIFEKSGAYYMVLGARSKEDVGCVLLYKSTDLKQWVYHMRIQSKEPFGYMWECPDIIEMDGKFYLVCCPQGVPQEGIEYQNIYQFGYFELALDLDSCEYSISSFKEMDKGFDIYAPQTYVDEQGRRILLAWMGIPDAPYHNEKTIEKGWQHALTMPRELYIKDGVLCQKPLHEFSLLRKEIIKETINNCFDHTVCAMYECNLLFTSCQQVTICLREGIYLAYKEHMLSLEFKDHSDGRDCRYVAVEELKNIQIFMDTSSIEIFINHGEYVMTTRYYTQEYTPLHIEGDCSMSISLFELNRIDIEELEE